MKWPLLECAGKMADLRPLIPHRKISPSHHRIQSVSTTYSYQDLQYIANYTLQLSTETRFTSFQIFHRCLSHYIQYNIISNQHERSQGNGSVNKNNHNRYDITLLLQRVDRNWASSLQLLYLYRASCLGPYGTFQFFLTASSSWRESLLQDLNKHMLSI